jgi:hypothetical protein
MTALTNLRVVTAVDEVAQMRVEKYQGLLARLHELEDEYATLTGQPYDWEEVELLPEASEHCVIVQLRAPDTPT